MQNPIESHAVMPIAADSALLTSSPSARIGALVAERVVSLSPLHCARARCASTFKLAPFIKVDALCLDVVSYGVWVLVYALSTAVSARLVCCIHEG